MDSVTRSLAAEWGDYGIRVNGIAPGTCTTVSLLTYDLCNAVGPIAATEGMSKLSGNVPSSEINEIAAQSIPMGRVGTLLIVCVCCVPDTFQAR